MVSITDKQAGKLWELLLQGAQAKATDQPQRLAQLKKEFVEILTWGSSIEAGKK